MAKKWIKGDGTYGVIWIMQSGIWRTSYWVTKGRYTADEVHRWECSSPVCPLYQLDIML